jgi:hypothetical protein
MNVAVIDRVMNVVVTARVMNEVLTDHEMNVVATAREMNAPVSEKNHARDDRIATIVVKILEIPPKTMGPAAVRTPRDQLSTMETFRLGTLPSLAL